LHGIRIKDAARGIAAFEISGNNLDRLEREYQVEEGSGLCLTLANEEFTGFVRCNG
jgi:hypothetical protein